MGIGTSAIDIARTKALKRISCPMEVSGPRPLMTVVVLSSIFT
jgi:hypothetical protein